MWKTMTSNNTSSSSPIEANSEAIKTTGRQILLQNQNKSLARKIRNLQEFATAYNLNLSNNDDRVLQTDVARENVQRMANDLISSIEETNKLNFGSIVAQTGGNSHRLLNRSRIETFYQELLDVMPPKWKEIFQQRQEQII
jgi:hypothetical protein